MKPCANYRKELAWLAINELEPRRAGELRAHLETCDGCRGYFEEMTRVAGALAVAAPLPLSRLEARSTFHRRVTEAVRAQDGPVVKSRQWRVAIPALCIVAIAVWALNQPSNRLIPPPVAVSAPARDLRPTLANYRIAAARSAEALDDLLTRQIKERGPAMPVYTASAFSAVEGTD